MPAPTRDPFQICGTTIDGKYRVLSVVGEGGFGVVYRGVHEGFGVPIALKCLKLPAHLDGAAQDDLVRKLGEEGRLLLQLSQQTSGIVQALDIGSFTAPGVGRVPYLVLEWLEGRTLAEELRARHARGEGGMTPREAVALLAPAAQALDVAHRGKIAHRDIKPENLFLVASGERTIKVLDFGIAKVLGDSPSAAEAVTSAGPTAFTPGYGAPEQFDKRRGASGPWTDVFALALVFVELVTGRRALDGDDAFELFRASADESRRPTLRARGAETTDALERVLEQALHVEPKARFARAGAFWEALSAAVEGRDAAGLAGVSAARPADASLSTAEFASAEGLDLGSAKTVGPSDPALTPTLAIEETTAAPGEVAVSKGATTRGGVVAAATAPQATAPRRRGAIAIAAALACSVGLAAFGLWTQGARAPAVPKLSPSSPSVAASSSAAPPASKNAEASALFAEALQAWRGGAPDDAVWGMEQAVALDRDLGAAQLRLALWKFNKKPIDARDHYDLASRHADSLSPRDRGLLAAVEPLLRDPWDLEAYEKRLEALTAKVADDAELWVYLGSARLKRLRFDAAIEALDRALALDKSTVAAWVLEAECLSMKGEPGRQLHAYEACLESAPRAVECQLQKTALQGRLGDCVSMREEAKRLLSMNPRSALTQKHLATALYATGAPDESVLEALGRAWSFRPDTERRTTELGDRAALAVLAGDLQGGAAFLEKWRAEVADRPDQDAHAFPALELAKVAREMGAVKRAGEVADEFAKRMSAWTEPSLTDWTIAFLPFRRGAGLISRQEHDRARAEWTERFRAKWKAAGRPQDRELEWMVWSNAYGAAVVTEADAREALATLPSEPSPVMGSGRWTAVDLALGKTYVLAGQAERALAPLRRVAGSCNALSDPTTATVAQLHLGMALEATGDAGGARAAYEKVLARWGKATPRSGTAEKARERLRGLGAGRAGAR